MQQPTSPHKTRLSELLKDGRVGVLAAFTMTDTDCSVMANSKPLLELHLCLIPDPIMVESLVLVCDDSPMRYKFDDSHLPKSFALIASLHFISVIFSILFFSFLPSYE